MNLHLSVCQFYINYNNNNNEAFFKYKEKKIYLGDCN
jgi:hypothetical protein